MSGEEAFHVSRAVEGGIERIVYTPRERRFRTPILMLHGMWHGAWGWQPWQEFFARRGWETHAFSLPGHGGSPVQRPIRWCTLDYYLRFLAAEVARLETPPVLIGHSMGGALVQWYLKHISDELPAAVLVAPWTAHAMLATILGQFRLDFIGAALSLLTLTATPNMRNPRVAARALITEGALLSPEELHARLGPESLLVLFQHNPPFWFPPQKVSAPVLWLAAGADAFFSVARQERSAARYGAEFVLIEGEGHDLMIERGSRRTAEIVHDWLAEQGVG